MVVNRIFDARITRDLKFVECRRAERNLISDKFVVYSGNRAKQVRYNLFSGNYVDRSCIFFVSLLAITQINKLDLCSLINI